MPEVIKIKKGLDIKLKGLPDQKTEQFIAEDIALKPTDFVGIFPKLFVKEGDKVRIGSPVFFDKYRDNIIHTSPVSGTVSEVRRGAKRRMLEIKIRSDGKMDHVDFGQADPSALSREEIVEKLLKSGIWPHIRQRPYSVIADPEDTPKSIHISAFDSAPLAPDYDYTLDGEAKNFQLGIEALSKLTTGKIYLGIRHGQTKSKTFLDARGVEIVPFEGPHPSGNVGTQIAKIDPINKGEIVWFLKPPAVVTIGKLFAEGKLDPYRTIAVTGSELKKTGYYKVISGTSVYDLISGNLIKDDIRIISGNVLTGSRIEKIGHLGFYDYQLTVIPEGRYHKFFGWAAPRIDKFSFSRSFFSWLMPSKRYRLDTNLNGGHRAFVMTGKFEQVFPFDIYPLQLIKSVMIEDIDEMEQLGIYEVDEEDFALCEFIDTSKTEIQSVIRKGLDLMRKEMT